MSNGPKLDLDSLIRDLKCDDGYDLNRWRARHAATALAAERDRADKAEARLMSAPHASYCWVYSNVPVLLLKTGEGMGRCTCWHSEATV
jgi:hypothetical protein